MQLVNSITSMGGLGEFFDGVLPIDSTGQWGQISPKRREIPGSSQNVPFSEWDISAFFNMLVDIKRSSALTDVLAPNVTILLKTARRELAFLSHHSRAEQAAHILDIFEQELRYLAYDVKYPIRLFESNDDALILEWATPGCRAVVNLEEDHEESGWHIVTRSNDSGCQTVGTLADLDIKRIVNCIATNLDKQ